jgi:hypothetical protein
MRAAKKRGFFNGMFKGVERNIQKTGRNGANQAFSSNSLTRVRDLGLKSFEMTQEFEEAILVKDLPEGVVVIERTNGERWRLDAKKDWCRWAWRYEEKKVRLKFGHVSSILLNDEGDSCEFWTEEQIA